MTKEKVLEILNDIVEVSLNTKGIDDDAEYMNEILEAEEYMRQCISNYTPDPKIIQEYVDKALTKL
jgi:hypothetical protein